MGDLFLFFEQTVSVQALGFSKKLENLEAACGLFLAYYNFDWRPRFADNSGKAGRRRLPPAMAAGVTDWLWRLEDLYEAAADRM